MADGNWSVAEAKARLSEVIEKARLEGPQHIRRNGREAVVVVSAAEWRARVTPARSVISLLTDPRLSARLKPGEERLFERSAGGARRSPRF